MFVVKQVLIPWQTTGHYKKLLALLGSKLLVACQQLDGEVTFYQDPPESREGIQIKKNADLIAREAVQLFRRTT